MDKAELLDIFTREQRIELATPDMIREVDGAVIRHVRRTGDGGFVIYSHLDEVSVEAAISAQIARFERIPQNFEWKLYDYDRPGDLIDRLSRRGFEIGDPESLLVFDLAASPEAFAEPAPGSVVRITDPDAVDQIVDLENTVWESDYHGHGELLKQDLRERPETLSVYIAYAGEQPASAAWVYFHPGSHFASLWGGATLAQFRHQGHYSHLLAARAQDARARGFSLLTVDASPMSRPILEKFGFQYLATTTPCQWTVRAKP